MVLTVVKRAVRAAPVREHAAGTRVASRLSFGKASSVRRRNPYDPTEVSGVAGLVSDGPVRDTGTLKSLDFPILCAGGGAALNLLDHHAVDQNIPIGCGSVAVYPGGASSLG